jgi:hypothetical protein
VAPQLAQQLLRHKDARTTLTHYTVLGLKDAAAAVGQIPALGAGAVLGPIATYVPPCQPTEQPSVTSTLPASKYSILRSCSPCSFARLLALAYVYHLRVPRLVY